MHLNDIQFGLEVRIAALGSTRGWSLEQKYLDRRREGATGKILNWVPGHGGDVWWIEHSDGSGLTPYAFDEFEPIEVQQ